MYFIHLFDINLDYKKFNAMTQCFKYVREDILKHL